jgi:serine/threonine protein kinase/formylglycine-generating enzyme required for sulfatase activity
MKNESLQQDLNSTDQSSNTFSSEAHCAEFQSALAEGSGLALEQHLNSCPKEMRLKVFPQLLRLELLHRRATGSLISTEEYRRRFPHFITVVDKVIRSLSTDNSQLNPGNSVDDLLATKTLALPETDTVVRSTRSDSRYEKQKELGMGAFGRVWLAKDQQLGRLVAIKEPHAQRFDDPKAQEEYLSEARVVAELDHPQIVPVYDVGLTKDGNCFVVSKYIDGESLASYFETHELSLDEAVGLTVKMAEALQHTHNLGLVHRDIKPANILLDRRGEPFLTDFGLAVRDEQLSMIDGVAGTPAYMSPEQVRGEGHRIDGRSDLFSLGVVLYELLTRRRPFPGKGIWELFENITNTEPVPLRQLNPAIPPELERICLKVLSKRPADRYQSAADFAADLRDWKKPPARQSKANNAPRLTPRGLRSFDAADSDFYLDLLPGPKDRDGLPEVLRFWKTRIEEPRTEDPVRVGLIYGPSGCGKSSLLKAGLLPRLERKIVCVSLEASPDRTESQLLAAVRRAVPDSPTGLTLAETLANIRRGRSLPKDQKLLIVIDQFEQWLHAKSHERFSELTLALRQCDGERLMAIFLIRDDFWVPASRFMQDLEVPIVEGQNSCLVDLFDLRHAERILGEFGKAYGCLAQDSTKWSNEQRDFLKQATKGISLDGQVVCVRLALLADLMKSRDWTPKELRRVGGVTGLGSVFLEETFCRSSASPILLQHQEQIQNLLRVLLPPPGEQIKGKRATLEELFQTADWSDQKETFESVIRVLDRELRIIAPADTETMPQQTQREDSEPKAGAIARSYQLTHDYLVPSLRDWLDRKQRETRRGRAELKLNDLGYAWSRQPETRNLPSLLEWLQILTWVPRKHWSEPQRELMKRATQRHLLAWGSVLGAITILIAGTQIWISREARINAQSRVSAAVDTVQGVFGNAIPLAIDNLRALDPNLVRNELDKRWETEQESARRRGLAYAKAQFGTLEANYLVNLAAEIPSTEFENLQTALASDTAKSLHALRDAASSRTDAESWKSKARLAALEIELGGKEIAKEMTTVSEGDRIGERELFIDEYPKFVDEIDKVLQLLQSEDDLSLASAFALAAAEFDLKTIPTEQKQALMEWADRVHRTHADRLIHSATGLILRRCGKKIELAPTTPISDKQDWLVNSRGMTLLRIKPGKFQQEAESNRLNIAREVEIPYEFWMADREVSAAAFEEFLRDSNYRAGRFAGSLEMVDDEITLTPEHPAQMLGIPDAIAFCNWLSEKEGLQPYYEQVKTGENQDAGITALETSWKQIKGANGYRLPTEEEWEYATRAGTPTLFSCGDDPNLLPRYAVYSLANTAPCGSLLPNYWGLFDMHGNAQEWCSDSIAATFPNAAYRGGRFMDLPGLLQSRTRLESNFSFGYDGWGFRIVRGGQPERLAEVMREQEAKLPLRHFETPEEIAKWILENGGRIGLGGESGWIERLDDLPQGKAGEIERVRWWQEEARSTPLKWTDVAAFKGFNRLQELELRGHPLGDMACRLLADFTELRSLNLHACGIGDEGLKSLASLTNLERLDLGFSNGRISDSGVAALANLQKLQFLNIYDSSLTDRALSEVFSTLPDLQKLELTRTNVTEAGVEAFKKEKPSCEVIK